VRRATIRHRRNDTADRSGATIPKKARRPDWPRRHPPLHLKHDGALRFR